MPAGARSPESSPKIPDPPVPPLFSKEKPEPGSGKIDHEKRLVMEKKAELEARAELDKKVELERKAEQERRAELEKKPAPAPTK